MGVPVRSRKDMVELPQVVELIQGEVDAVNAQLARFETIKKFVVADVEFTQENNMMTPTLKVKRKVVGAHFAEKIERLYAE